MSRDDPQHPPAIHTMMAGLDDVPIISEDVDLTNLPESQLDNYVRQAKDTYSDIFPEGREPLVQTDCAPMILLAKNVTDAVFASRFLPIKARYLLDENLNLYIRKVAGPCHGVVSSQASINCGFWRDGQGLFRSVDVAIAVLTDYADTKLEPDVAMFARSDGRNSSPRCIFELQVNNRPSREARKLVAVYFRNPNVRCAVLFKVWNRLADGTFAAACIIWVRGEDNGIECRAAHDFGTAPINVQARNNLSGANDDPPLPFPFVPVEMQYTPPTPIRHPITDRTAQVVEIPASALIMNATNERGEQLEGLDPPIENLQLDLSVYAELIERTLER